MRNPCVDDIMSRFDLSLPAFKRYVINLFSARVFPAIFIYNPSDLETRKKASDFAIISEHKERHINDILRELRIPRVRRGGHIVADEDIYSRGQYYVLKADRSVVSVGNI